MAGKPHIINPREAWQTVKKNWIIQVVNKTVVATLLIALILIAWRWNRLPPKIPLWYSRPWGIDQLAPPIWLFLLPLGGLAIYFINLFVSEYLIAEYLIFTQMLFLSSLLINVLSLVTLVKILFLIT